MRSAETTDYTSLRGEAVEQLDALSAAAARAAEAGVDVEREEVTITTAELFLAWAEWDSQHTEEVEEAISKWWRVKQEAPRLARELPQNEMNDLVRVLAGARRELEQVMRGTLLRRPAFSFDRTALTEKEGYLHQGNRPVFLSSFTWQPDEEKLNRTYGGIRSLYIHLPHIREEGDEPNIGYEPTDDEPFGFVFLGQKHVPGWLKKKYPEITRGEHHFTGFDTDHPAARRLWATMLAHVVPQVKGRKVSQGGYMLTNEPHWFTATDQWATGPVSDYTLAGFRAWLEQRHRTIEALNALWETDFVSFADVTIEIPIDAALRGQPIWYDWCRFNMDRITEWFTFLRREIRRHDPTAKAHIKLIPGLFAGSNRSHGLDFEALVRLQDIIGCDAGIVKTPHWKKEETWTERYACNWRDQALPLDFFRSVSPGKMVLDSEWHSLSKANLRDPHMPAEYVRSALWLAHLHGMGVNQTWYWGRNSDGSPKGESGFHASCLTQPIVLDAFGRTMKELNAFAPEAVALAPQPKRIPLFYSETSAISDAAYMEHVYNAYRALYHSGMPLGFVTGQLLAEAGSDDLENWPAVIVTHANRVTVADRRALGRYLARGGTLIVAGSDSLGQDEYGRPHAGDLRTGTGRILAVANTEDALRKAVARIGLVPSISLQETNAVGPAGCVWRTAPWEDGHLLLIINLGRSEAQITLSTKTPCRDLVTGSTHTPTFKMRPFDVELLHVKTAEGFD